MKYLKKVESLPTTLEEGVLYYDSTEDKVALKKAKVVPQGFVDLGLPNGTLWAECNIGASKPEEFGKYFQWGDTVGYIGDEAKVHSTWATAPFNDGSTSYNADYFTANSGTWLTEKAELKKEYDAAYAATDGKQVMPTTDQFKELCDNTTSEWTRVNGIAGRKFTSKTDPTKYIFVPASGYFTDGYLRSDGSSGGYWSSSLYSGYLGYAYLLLFSSSGVNPQRLDYTRYYGFSVRGVLAQN